MAKSLQEQILGSLPGTAKSIAQATFRDEKSIHNMFKKMHEAEAIHISGWQVTLRNPAAVYSRGWGEDAPRPIPRGKYNPSPRAPVERVTAVPIVTQALSQPNSIWAYAQKL